MTIACVLGLHSWKTDDTYPGDSVQVCRGCSRHRGRVGGHWRRVSCDQGKHDYHLMCIHDDGNLHIDSNVCGWCGICEDVVRRIEQADFTNNFFIHVDSDPYRDLLKRIPKTPSSNVELLIFMAWVTQFGLRIFSRWPKLEHTIISTIFNQLRLADAVQGKVGSPSIAMSLGRSFVDAVDGRWQAYDAGIHSSEARLDSSEAINVANRFVGMLGCSTDPFATYAVSVLFLTHLASVRDQAIGLGLMEATPACEAA